MLNEYLWINCELVHVFNVLSIAGWTPLHEACNHGHTQVVTILIDKGVNINAAGMGGDTPLHDAVVNNHTEVHVHTHNHSLNKVCDCMRT